MSYVADPERWYFLLQIPGLWRAMFLVNEDATDERVQTREFAQSLMAGVIPGISNYEISHTTLYKVHQRVAKTFRLGRAFLVGDAAHINNPLGGMGMNGGIHDADQSRGAARRGVAWQGRRRRARPLRQAAAARDARIHPEVHDPEQEEPGIARRRIPRSLRAIAADPARTREYLMRVSMIASLSRAEELG